MLLKCYLIAELLKHSVFFFLFDFFSMLFIVFFFFFERRTQRGREEASIYLECDASVKPGGEEAARGDQN